MATTKKTGTTKGKKTATTKATGGRRPRKVIITPEQIRAIRESKEMTQEEFASDIKVTFSTVNRWENGHSTPQRAMAHMLLGMVPASAATTTDEPVAEEATEAVAEAA